MSEVLGINEIAAAAGLSRRAVRFYVQRGLLDPPSGRGRGSHYTRAHLERLATIQRLQSAGHSLEAIKRILDEGIAAPEPAAGGQRRRPRATVAAEVWSRLRIGEGIELHVDPTRYPIDADTLREISRTLRDMLDRVTDDPPEDSHS